MINRIEIRNPLGRKNYGTIIMEHFLKRLKKSTLNCTLDMILHDKVECNYQKLSKNINKIFFSSDFTFSYGNNFD